MRCWTHGGKQHADDVLACAIARMVFPGIDFYRGDEPPEEGFEMAIDIGGVCDAQRMRFDHHNGVKCPEPPSCRSFPYAAAGLLWRQFGRDICQDYIDRTADHLAWRILRRQPGFDAKPFIEPLFRRVDSELIAPIDGWDNGLAQSEFHRATKVQVIPLQALVAHLEFEAALGAMASLLGENMDFFLGEWAEEALIADNLLLNRGCRFLDTREGVMIVSPGDWPVNLHPAKKVLRKYGGLPLGGVISPLPRKKSRWVLILTRPLSVDIAIPAGIQWTQNRKRFYASDPEPLLQCCRYESELPEPPRCG